MDHYIILHSCWYISIEILDLLAFRVLLGVSLTLDIWGLKPFLPI